MRVDEELGQLLGERNDAVVARAAAADGAVAMHRPRNYDVLMALEHSLAVGCALSLRLFQYLRAPRKLEPGEERKFVEYTWPEPQGCVRRRAVIETAATGHRRWEVPISVEAGVWTRYAIHLVIDQCQKGWHCAGFLFAGAAALRGTYTLDRTHTQMSLQGEALASSGLVLLRLQWIAALNAVKGPSKTQTHGRTMKECGRLLFSSITSAHATYQLVYEEMADDLDMFDRTRLWTPEHLEEVFQEGKRRFLAAGTGVTARKDRWLKVEEAFKRKVPLSTVYLLILLLWGVRAKC